MQYEIQLDNDMNIKAKQVVGNFKMTTCDA